MIKLLDVQISLIDNDNVRKTAEVFYEAPYACLEYCFPTRLQAIRQVSVEDRRVDILQASILSREPAFLFLRYPCAGRIAQT